MKAGETADIHLAARRAGEGVDHVDVGGQHVARNAKPQKIAKFDGIGRDVVGDDVGDQFSVFIRARYQDRGFQDGGMFGQHGGDLLGLDAVPADLDLPIQTPQEFQTSIREPADAIAGAIKALADLAGRLLPLHKGIGDKTLGSEAGAMAVSASQARAADEQLARRADGRRHPMFIEHIDACVGDGAANRRLGGVILLHESGVRLPHGGDHCGFGGAVGVEDEGTARMALQPAAQEIGPGALAANDDESQRSGRFMAVREH